MGARHKLNAAYFYASLLVACVIGGGSGSWFVFMLTLAILVGACFYAGNIRPDRRR